MAQKTNNIDPQVVEMLLKDYKKPEDLLGETGNLKPLQIVAQHLLTTFLYAQNCLFCKLNSYKLMHI